MAIETYSWPNWLKQIWPSWLENIGYPVAGVGDLSDLKVSLGVGQDGRWIGFVNPGWYYYRQIENYNYVQAGTVLVSAVSGQGSVSESISFRPSWGPIQAYVVSGSVVSYSVDGAYREHHNSFYPGYPLNFSPHTSDILQATVPVSCIVVGMRNLTNLPMGAVAGTASILNETQYYYNAATRKVFIKPKDPSDYAQPVWADLLYTYPILKFREVVISEVDASGNNVVLPSYQQINDVQATRDTTTVLVSGYHSSGYITHSLSGVNAGDWVILDYWITRSFTLPSHNTLDYFCGGSEGASAVQSFRIFYETSIPDLLENINVTVPSTGIYQLFNVNPLFEFGYKSGYLFAGSPASGINSYWTPTKLELYLDKEYVCHSWNEYLKAKITLLDDNDLPIPYYNLTVTVSGGSAVLMLPETRTDGRGDVHYLIKPLSGAPNITVTATCEGLSASAVATIYASASLIDSSKWQDGFVHIVVTNERTGRGGFRTFITTSSADGLPRAHSTTLISKLSSEFHRGSDTLTRLINISSSVSINNIQALSEVGYVPQPNDALFGYSNTANSKILKSE